jgi:hypothetical protein
MGMGDNTIQSGDSRSAARREAARHRAKSLTPLAAALMLALTACGRDLEHEGAWGQGAASALPSIPVPLASAELY